MIPAVVFDNVSFAYKKNRPILENVFLDISEGEFSAIVGPNGGGKTTLLRLMLGLLSATSGDIRVFGKPPHHARRRMGYMPQFIAFDMRFPITVFEIVLMGRLGRNVSGYYNKKDRDIAKQALDEVDLLPFMASPFNSLSGGQRQRVLIARAICCEPDILLLDEPTSHVDPQAEQDIIAILKRLNQRMTILLVSHDLGFVSSAVRSVICVNKEVMVHPTEAVNGAVIETLYHEKLSFVRHDHRCSEKGHQHE